MADRLWNSLYTGPVYLTERQASKLPWWEWKAPGPGRIRLYHFTPKGGHFEIVRGRSVSEPGSISIRRRDHGTNATINFSLQEMRDNKPAPDAWEGDGIYLTNIVPGTVTHRCIVRHLWNVNAAKSPEYLRRAAWCIGLEMPADLPERVGLRKWVLRPGTDTNDIEVVSHRRNFERPLSEVEDDIRQNSGLSSVQIEREVAHVQAQDMTCRKREKVLLKRQMTLRRD
jgi:hypothetical protein